MHVYLGADHRGYQLKDEIISWLQGRQIPFTDFGAVSYDAEDDFNDYAKKVAIAITSNHDDNDFGILLCGSGQGMAMQANRYKGVRAAICDSAIEAMETRGHNNANVLCISADENSHNYAEIIDAFMDTKPIDEEKYKRRCRKLDED
ncbi:RpiB/LacA/LacB family sugar-phosphate isomerase [Candidatus Saccharibacteria bacterium]|nr:RpiB/LacA/LacB family sugar-phosphate isomerase [Candidatus Saccharibacteria bacterium]